MLFMGHGFLLVLPAYSSSAILRIIQVLPRFLLKFTYGFWGVSGVKVVGMVGLFFHFYS